MHSPNEKTQVKTSKSFFIFGFRGTIDEFEISDKKKFWTLINNFGQKPPIYEPKQTEKKFAEADESEKKIG